MGKGTGIRTRTGWVEHLQTSIYTCSLLTTSSFLRLSGGFPSRQPALSGGGFDLVALST